MSNSSLVSYTKLSPNCTVPRKNSIDTITIHCVVGQVTAERLGEIFANPNAQKSCNYGVDKDGRVALIVDESARSWCSATGNAKDTNDHRAVTIEVASDTTPPYSVNYSAFHSLIALCVDICQRNGKTSLVFLGSRSATENEWAKGKTDTMYLTAHKWFADTDCPGDYLYSRFDAIADIVTSRLTEPKPSEQTITFPVTAVSKGSKGDDVLRVQTILKGLGFYSGVLDSDCGTKTVAAIKSYQQKNKLYLDGIWAEKCWEHWFGLN